MLSELALIDWIALLIAIVLLGVAAVATYLSHASAGPSLFGSATDSMSMSEISSPTDLLADHQPAHASSSATGESVSTNGVHPPPVPAHALHADEDDSEDRMSEVVLPDAPAPPIVIRSTPSEDVIDLRTEREETVAERAERLRNRPISESEARQSRATAEAPELLFASATNKLSVGMETVAGFASRQPGFFDDPAGRHELRYWNGHAWTEYVKEDGDRFIDPL